MSKVTARFVLPAILLGMAAGLTSCGKREAAPEVHMTVDLSDGTRLIGGTTLRSLALQTDVGKIDVPFTKVKDLTFGDDHHGAVVTLTNDDRFSGTYRLDQVPLKTLCGDITVDAAFIRKIVCAAKRDMVLPRQGLVQ